MLDVNVDVDLTELTMELTTFLGRVQNQHDVNMQAAEILRAMVDDKFESEGPGWDELSPATILRRRVGGSRILQDSGHLAGSLTAYAGADFAEVYTNVLYAKYHLTGTENMPARDFLDIDEEKALEAISNMILETIARER